MSGNHPNFAWLATWAIAQIISVVLAMTIISSIFATLPRKSAAILFVALVCFHWTSTYGLLVAANIAIVRPAAITSYVTAALLAVVLCPTEPRMAQTLAATVFLGFVLWQTLLKFLEE